MMPRTRTLTSEQRRAIAKAAKARWGKTLYVKKKTSAPEHQREHQGSSLGRRSFLVPPPESHFIMSLQSFSPKQSGI
jgi:hypothetical protein